MKSYVNFFIVIFLFSLEALAKKKEIQVIPNTRAYEILDIAIKTNSTMPKRCGLKLIAAGPGDFETIIESRETSYSIKTPLDTYILPGGPFNSTDVDSLVMRELKANPNIGDKRFAFYFSNHPYEKAYIAEYRISWEEFKEINEGTVFEPKIVKTWVVVVPTWLVCGPG